MKANKPEYANRWKYGLEEKNKNPNIEGVSLPKEKEKINLLSLPQMYLPNWTNFEVVLFWGGNICMVLTKKGEGGRKRDTHTYLPSCRFREKHLSWYNKEGENQLVFYSGIAVFLYLGAETPEDGKRGEGRVYIFASV